MLDPKICHAKSYSSQAKPEQLYLAAGSTYIIWLDPDYMDPSYNLGKASIWLCHQQTHQNIDWAPLVMWQGILSVVYFDQQTGAPHTVCWLKSIF